MTILMQYLVCLLCHLQRSLNFVLILIQSFITNNNFITCCWWNVKTEHHVSLHWPVFIAPTQLLWQYSSAFRTHATCNWMYAVCFVCFFCCFFFNHYHLLIHWFFSVNQIKIRALSMLAQLAPIFQQIVSSHLWTVFSVMLGRPSGCILCKWQKQFKTTLSIIRLNDQVLLLRKHLQKLWCQRWPFLIYFIATILLLLYWKPKLCSFLENFCVRHNMLKTLHLIAHVSV